MTHYLVMTCMEKKSLEYMLDTLKHEFFNNPEYLKKWDMCTCKEKSGTTFREIKLFEIDVPTPATEHFEEWLEEWGFADLYSRNQERHFAKHSFDFLTTLPLRVEGYIFKILWKIFYKVMNIIVTIGDPQTRLKISTWIDLKEKSFFNLKSVYRPFAPMSKKYAHEHKREYKGNLKLNQRNFIIGKKVETPVGSYDRIPCEKCKAKHQSGH